MPTGSFVLAPRAWRTVFVGLCAFPVTLGSALLSLLGQRERAGALTLWLRRWWFDVDAKGALPVRAWRMWAAALLSLGVFVVTAYLLIGIVINLAYPLRPDAKPTDWGGPSLAGRWLAHGSGGVGFAVVTPFICRWLRGVVARIL